MPALESLIGEIRSFFNALDLSVRSKLCWQRQYREPKESKANLWAHRLDAQTLLTQESQLIQEYNLEDFKANSSQTRYLETLTYLTFLEELLEGEALPSIHAQLRWLDVGAKNWSYVEALYAYLTRFSPSFQLHGLELDGYRRYANLYSRRDYAQAYIRERPLATYEVGDVLQHHGQYEVISSFLPFVFQKPCLAWGLPKRFFCPQRMVEHLIDLLVPGGVLLIINQGAEEAEAQAKLLEAVASKGELRIQPKGELPPAFIPYQYQRFGWICRKKQ